MLSFITKENTDKPKLIFISPNKVVPNKNQPRKTFDESKMFELAESVKEHGIIQPISVRKLDNDCYELVAGERRLRAAILVGLETIPAILTKISDSESFVIAIIENIQRHDLNYFEEANSYEKLLSECGFTQDELAKKLGKTQSTIANKLRILKLPQNIKEILISNNMTERHARALLKITDKEMQEKALKEMVSKNLNVQQSEFLIMSMLGELEKKEVKKKTDRRFITLFKDIRIFSNTINQAVDMIKKAGIPAMSDKNETDTYIEYKIRIDKNSLKSENKAISIS